MPQPTYVACQLYRTAGRLYCLLHRRAHQQMVLCVRLELSLTHLQQPLCRPARYRFPKEEVYAYLHPMAGGRGVHMPPQRMRLSPALLCEVRVEGDEPNVVEPLPMPHKVDDLQQSITRTSSGVAALAPG